MGKRGERWREKDAGLRKKENEGEEGKGRIS